MSNSNVYGVFQTAVGRCENQPTEKAPAGALPVHLSVAHKSVVMTAFAMDVTMSDFFLAGVTNVDNLDLEVQALPGQWVVAVNGDVIAFQIADGDDLHLAIGQIGRASCRERVCPYV